ncbi:MAG: DUF1269 domain-containing protein [Gammaproteobacteria bacterium]
MSKLYFLAPDVKTAEDIVGALREIGLGDDDLGVIARSESMVEELPEPGIQEISDVKPAMKNGIAVGAASGVLAGLAAIVIPGGMAVGGPAIFAMVVGGGAFGAWASSLIGVSVPNREVEVFQSAIDKGQVLMIVSTTQVSEETIKGVVAMHHPEVVYGGKEHFLSDAA